MMHVGRIREHEEDAASS